MTETAGMLVLNRCPVKSLWRAGPEARCQNWIEALGAGRHVETIHTLPVFPKSSEVPEGRCYDSFVSQCSTGLVHYRCSPSVCFTLSQKKSRVRIEYCHHWQKEAGFVKQAAIKTNGPWHWIIGCKRDLLLTLPLGTAVQRTGRLELCLFKTESRAHAVPALGDGMWTNHCPHSLPCPVEMRAEWLCWPWSSLF